MANNPYGSGPKLNEYTVPAGGVIVEATGHLHSGGLSTDLYLKRNLSTGSKNATRLPVDGRVLEPHRSGVVGHVDDRDPADVEDAREGGRRPEPAGHSTTRASRSWYESMGIMIAWYAPGAGGNAAFSAAVSGVPGVVTHGHLSPENDNHGGGVDAESARFGRAAERFTGDGHRHQQFRVRTRRPRPARPSAHRAPGRSDHVQEPRRAGQRLRDVPHDHRVQAPVQQDDRSRRSRSPTVPLVFDSGQLGNYGAPTKGSRDVDHTREPSGR